MTRYDTIKAFVEESITASVFEEYVYQADFEMLTTGVPAPPYAGHADSLYTYAISLNFSNPEHVSELQSLLCTFLEEHGVSVTPSGEMNALHRLLTAVQPSWLDVPMDYMMRLVRDSGGKTGNELKTYVKDAIKRNFKCLGKKPIWIQSPQWPIADGIPLVFVGQLDTGDLFHDKGSMYVFFNPRSGEATVVTQVS